MVHEIQGHGTNIEESADQSYTFIMNVIFMIIFCGFTSVFALHMYLALPIFIFCAARVFAFPPPRINHVSSLRVVSGV